MRNPRFLLVTVISVLILVLVGALTLSCAEPTPTPATPSPTTPAPTTPKPTTPTITPSPIEGELPEVNFRLQSTDPPGDWDTDVGMKNMADWISQESGGKFTIDIFHDGDFSPGDQLMTAVGEGLLEVGYGAASYWSGLDPALDLSFGLPMAQTGTFGDTWAFQMESRYSEMVRDILGENGVHYVGWFTFGEYPTIMSTVPIHTIEDYEGLKIRISGYCSGLFDAMGGATTWFPGSEIAQSISTGVVDVACWSPDGITTMGLAN
jgi:TRAP-type mannitol/chloroaromatic compound transport system substrate-binding protein